MPISDFAGMAEHDLTTAASRAAELEERHRAMLAVLAEKDAEIERLRAEIADLKISIIAFGCPPMMEWAKMHALPKNALYADHYDILQRAGARMDDFTRWDEAPKAASPA